MDTKDSEHSSETADFHQVESSSKPAAALPTSTLEIMALVYVFAEAHATWDRGDGLEGLKEGSDEWWVAASKNKADMYAARKSLLDAIAVFTSSGSGANMSTGRNTDSSEHSPSALSDLDIEETWALPATGRHKNWVIDFARAIEAKALSKTIAVHWIAVSERLPHQGEVVLCRVGAVGRRKQRFVVLKACHPQPGVHDDEDFGWFDENGNDYVWPVTHWAPLRTATKALAAAA